MGRPRPADAALLRVRVQPRASRDEVVEWDGFTLRVKVTAPPVDGQANDRVCDLIARALRVAPSSVSLVRGARGRDKLVRIQGLSGEALKARVHAGLA